MDAPQTTNTGCNAVRRRRVAAWAGASCCRGCGQDSLRRRLLQRLLHRLLRRLTGGRALETRSLRRLVLDSRLTRCGAVVVATATSARRGSFAAAWLRGSGGGNALLRLESSFARSAAPRDLARCMGGRRWRGRHLLCGLLKPRDWGCSRVSRPQPLRERLCRVVAPRAIAFPGVAPAVVRLSSRPLRAPSVLGHAARCGPALERGHHRLQERVPPPGAVRLLRLRGSPGFQRAVPRSSHSQHAPRLVGIGRGQRSDAGRADLDLFRIGPRAACRPRFQTRRPCRQRAHHDAPPCQLGERRPRLLPAQHGSAAAPNPRRVPLRPSLPRLSMLRARDDGQRQRRSVRWEVAVAQQLCRHAVPKDRPSYLLNSVQTGFEGSLSPPRCKQGPGGRSRHAAPVLRNNGLRSPVCHPCLRVAPAHRQPREAGLGPGDPPCMPLCAPGSVRRGGNVRQPVAEALLANLTEPLGARACGSMAAHGSGG